VTIVLVDVKARNKIEKAPVMDKVATLIDEKKRGGGRDAEHTWSAGTASCG